MSTKTIYDELRGAIDGAKALTDLAVNENRDLAEGERTALLDFQAKAENLGQRITAQREALALGEKFGGLLVPAKSTDLAPRPAMSLSGAPAPTVAELRSVASQIVRSGIIAQYKSTRGPVAMEIDRKAPIAYPSVPAGGAGILPALEGPRLVPMRPVVASLMGQGQTDAGIVPYVEIAVTPKPSYAQPGPGTAKQETPTVITQKLSPVETIATWVEVPDQLLEDMPALESTLETVLAQLLYLDEDRQLIKGTGINGELVGITTLGISPPIAGDSAHGASAILAQYMALLGASGFMPTGMAIAPDAVPGLMTAQSATGSYLMPGAPFDRSPLPFRVWGLETIVSPALGSGEALLGAWATNSVLYRKNGLRVSMSPSHADNFIKNITVIRVEIRAAVVWFTPKAWGKVTGLATAPVAGVEGARTPPEKNSR